MATFLPDDIMVCNIVALLPAKPLIRFQCVSKYWNHMLTQPNIMKLRSRKTVILPLHDDTIHLIDDTDGTIVQRCYPPYVETFGPPSMLLEHSMGLSFWPLQVFSPITIHSQARPKTLPDHLVLVQHLLYTDSTMLLLTTLRLFGLDEILTVFMSTILKEHILIQ
ncbi:putative F-box-like domain superfamily protein [Helianthus anomalus]